MKKDFRIFITNFLEWFFSRITHMPSISLKCFLQGCEIILLVVFTFLLHFLSSVFTVLLFTSRSSFFFHFLQGLRWLPLFEGHTILLVFSFILCKLLFSPFAFPLNFYYGVSQKRFPRISFYLFCFLQICLVAFIF